MAAFTLRYARAFEQVLVSMNLDAAAAMDQLRSFAGTLGGSHELREVLMNPSIVKQQKLAVLDAIAAKLGMLPQVRNFIAVIVDHQRLHELDEIVVECAAAADNQVGLKDAEITTAFPLNDSDRLELEAQVGKLAGGRVRATYFQDNALLGGAIVKIGSTVYDGSVRGQLQQMKKALVGA